MLNRDTILRRARILDYDRFYTPSLGMLSNPDFEYEYVHSYRISPIEEGSPHNYRWGYDWRKGRNRDYSKYPNELERMIQENEVRARKEMPTSELRTLLEEGHPLHFVFPDGINTVVLPKLDASRPEYEVYLRYTTEPKDLYVEQRSLSFEDELHNRWFNKERASSQPGQDWRYLLRLNIPDSDPVNVLYKYFEGIYTGDLEELKKGNEQYKSERYPAPTNPDEVAIYDPTIDTKIVEKIADSSVTKKMKIRKTKKDNSVGRAIFAHNQIKHYTPELAQMVCVKNPVNGDILRIERYRAVKKVKNGWLYASKEEWKTHSKAFTKKKKEMAEDNVQEQMNKYKGPKQPTKGIAGGPYYRYQTIEVWPKDEKGKRLTEDDIETFRILVWVPIYEYIPQYFRVKDSTGKVLEETLMYHKKVLVTRKETWVEFKHKVRPTLRTIKVLQIPSKQMQLLKAVTNKPSYTKPEGSTPVLLNVHDTRFDSKLYCEKEDVVRPKYEEYLVTKRDAHGKVVNITKRKLVK